MGLTQARPKPKTRESRTSPKANQRGFIRLTMKNRREGDDPTQRRLREPLSLAGGNGDDHATDDDGEAQRVDQRLGQEPAFEVAVRQLNETDQQQQGRDGVGRPADPVEHVGRQEARHGSKGDPLRAADLWRRLVEGRGQFAGRSGTHNAGRQLATGQRDQERPGCDAQGGADEESQRGAHLTRATEPQLVPRSATSDPTHRCPRRLEDRTENAGKVEVSSA